MLRGNAVWVNTDTNNKINQLLSQTLNTSDKKKQTSVEPYLSF